MSEQLNTESDFTAPEKIFEFKEATVIVPPKPLVPPSEGTHLRVIPTSEQEPYFKPEAKISESLKPFVLALATARAEIGNPNKKDYHYWSQWVNVHLLPRFGGQDHLQIEVIGRNARGKTWAEPIDYPMTEEYEQYAPVPEEVDFVKQDLPEEVDKIWNEVNEDELFQLPEEEITPDEKSIYNFGKYEIRMPRKNPHVRLGGLHFWVHSYAEEQEGVQSNLKGGVEQFIVASAVAKSIYAELGRAIEIHFSGNWGLPSYKQEKEGKSYQENLTAHANMYAAPEGKDYVELPKRPVYERPAFEEELRDKVKAALEKNMPKYLEEFKGKKVSEVVK